MKKNSLILSLPVNLLCFIKGPSRKWYEAFLLRHPELTLRKPEPVTSASATVTSKNLDFFFENIVNYIAANKLEHLYGTPSAFLNLDESGFELNVLPSKVLVSRKAAHSYAVETAKHNDRITVTACICADGTYLTPQIIYKSSFSRMDEAAALARGIFY